MKSKPKANNSNKKKVKKKSITFFFCFFFCFFFGKELEKNWKRIGKELLVDDFGQAVSFDWKIDGRGEVEESVNVRRKGIRKRSIRRHPKRPRCVPPCRSERRPSNAVWADASAGWSPASLLQSYSPSPLKKRSIHHNFVNNHYSQHSSTCHHSFSGLCYLIIRNIKVNHSISLINIISSLL